MILRKMATAATALALVSAPIAATAAEGEQRAAAPAGETSEMGGSPILAVLAAVLIGVGIYIAVDGDDDDPISV
ncbi:hypothetical protein [Croceicoccus sp. Ery5]|jgi:predicted transporter|uniref:hypothetical protein n=1 Tax=Croceicoccus sp. Ery5 TaxID=1703340 RepID=UPI001E500246|nr:hypothetical protein [Croceicoccus sp. Ery5]